MLETSTAERLVSEEIFESFEQVSSLEKTDTGNIVEAEQIEEDISEVRSIKAAFQGFLSGEEEEKVEVSEEESEDITEVSAAEDEEGRSIKTVVQSFFSADIEDSDSATDELDKEKFLISEADRVTNLESEQIPANDSEVVEVAVDDENEESESELLLTIEEGNEAVLKLSIKERMLNFFRKETPAATENTIADNDVSQRKEEETPNHFVQNKLVNFFTLLSLKSSEEVSHQTDLEAEIAETLVKGPAEMKDLMEKSKKPAIRVETLGACPKVTKENWVQLFMGRSFLCFVSFSLNLSVLIASYLLYF